MLIKLIVGNSACKIDGLPVEHYNALRKLLSYTPETSDYGMAHLYRKYLISKRGEFPTGLLYIVEDYLSKAKLKFSLTDTRIAPKRDLKGFNATIPFPPHKEQKEAGEAAMLQKRGIVVAPTGTGKSLIAILMIQAIKVNTLVVVPGIELKRQLLESLTEAFGETMVGTLKDKRKIAVENVDSLDPKTLLKGYDCVIIDEFHHSGASTYRDLNKYAWVNVYYKLGLTATPFRSRDEERLLLESVLSKVIYKIDYDTAVAKKYIVPMEAYYIEVPPTEIKGNQRSWHAMYAELVVNNLPRNDLIIKLLNLLNESNISSLCLVKEIKHGDNLTALNPELPFTNGTDEDSRRYVTQFNACKVSTLIGTTGVLGEGVDTKPCEWVIIAGLGKSKNAFMQACGRAFRNFKNKETCKVVIFKDPSHKWTKAHFAAQLKILKDEYNIKPIKLSLT